MDHTGVVRLQHDGREWLHVTGTDGLGIGWMCLSPTALYCLIPGREQELRWRVASWLGGPVDSMPQPISASLVSEASPSTTVVPGVSVASSATPAPVVTDLAGNLAGQGVRQKAVEARDEAPVRTALARVLGVHTNERAWRMGAQGEELVGAQLKKLEPAWRAIHSVPVGAADSDIDHVVIGPGGVFTINTKHHKDAKVWVRGNTFKVNGFNQPYVRNSRFEASRASKLLSNALGRPVPVKAIIAVVNAGNFTVKQQPQDVVVMAHMELRTWLKKRPVVLSPADVEAIHSVARRKDTWRTR
jgi:hypothetical protein